MSQITLTSPLQALIPAFMSRRSRALEGARGDTSSTRLSGVVGLPSRTRATASFDWDMTRAQSQLFLALR